MLSDLENLLRSIRNQDVVYVPNSGNVGDSFIAHATYQLFGRVGLNFQLGNLSGTYPRRTIICGGGGNLVAPYPNMVDFLRRNMGQWQQLVILPHTIRSYEDTLQQFGSNCIVFCRERPSFDFVASNSSQATVLLSHDLALSCDFTETKRQIADRWASDLLDRVLLIRNSKRLVRSVNYWLVNLGRKQVLNSLRTDVEKTTVDIPGSNIDLSHAFAADDMSSASSLYATYWTMRFINGFEIVRTNRLHIGIMSAMLGKQVHLFDNSYGKIRDVFDHSLRDQFSNVQWRGDTDKDRADATA